MKYNRFLPILIPLIVYFLLQLLFYRPRLIYVIVVIVFLLLFFTLRQFIIASKRGEKWYNFIILPGCFFIGLTAFSVLIPIRSLVQALFIVNTVFLYFYFRTTYYYLLKIEYYRKNSLENLSSYGNFLAFYFIASAMYGLRVFLNLEVWLLMLIVLFFIALIAYQVMWANRIDLRIGIFYILLISLILTELTWSASFLTLNFYILGLIIAVCYYILIGLVRFHLLDKLTKRLVKLYLIYGFGSILVVLLTANWV